MKLLLSLLLLSTVAYEVLCYRQLFVFHNCPCFISCDEFGGSRYYGERPYKKVCHSRNSVYFPTEDAREVNLEIRCSGATARIFLQPANRLGQTTAIASINNETVPCLRSAQVFVCVFPIHDTSVMFYYDSDDDCFNPQPLKAEGDGSTGPLPERQPVTFSASYFNMFPSTDVSCSISSNSSVPAECPVTPLGLLGFEMAGESEMELTFSGGCKTSKIVISQPDHPSEGHAEIHGYYNGQELKETHAETYGYERAKGTYVMGNEDLGVALGMKFDYIYTSYADDYDFY